ncbi:MAG: HEAT repeat domain-containing protein [Pseudomonadota bacterium]
MPTSLLLLVSLGLAQEPPVATDSPAPTEEVVPAPTEEVVPAPVVEAAVQDGIAPPPEEPCPTDEASADLLQTLLLLLANETGAMAAEHLGTLGDDRAVAPLVHTARTRKPEVARAACRALAHYPQALPSLVALASDETLPDEVQVEAVGALGAMGSPEAGDALVGLMRSSDLPRAVRAAVLVTVRTRYPERASEVEGEVSQRGTGWLMVGGAGGLGYGLASVGYYGQADLEPLGGVTGALAGGSLGFVAGRHWPIEAGEAAFLSMSGVIGTTSGLLVGCGVGGDSACWNGGLLGEAAGFGLGAALKGRRTRRQGETVEALVLSGATGLAAGTGFNYGVARARRDQEDGWDDAAHAAQISTGLGLAGGFAAGQLLAPRVDLSGSDIGMMTLGATWGGFAGGLLLGVDSDGETVATGLGLGALTAYGLANPMELGGDAVFTG